jgi:hypothetical protein
VAGACASAKAAAGASNRLNNKAATVLQARGRLVGEAGDRERFMLAGPEKKRRWMFFQASWAENKSGEHYCK